MERQHINPTNIFKHPAYTRIVTVKGPMKIIFIAGQTPSEKIVGRGPPGGVGRLLGKRLRARWRVS